VVLADEPTGNLDTATRDDIQRLFFDLRERTNQTFVIVTHDETLAQMSDRMIVMSDGSIK
jgi:lipoprotein-releasing system ATP-binding protein